MVFCLRVSTIHRSTFRLGILASFVIWELLLLVVQPDIAAIVDYHCGDNHQENNEIGKSKVVEPQENTDAKDTSKPSTTTDWSYEVTWEFFQEAQKCHLSNSWCNPLENTWYDNHIKVLRILVVIWCNGSEDKGANDEKWENTRPLQMCDVDKERATQ